MNLRCGPIVFGIAFLPAAVIAQPGNILNPSLIFTTANLAPGLLAWATRLQAGATKDSPPTFLGTTIIQTANAFTEMEPTGHRLSKSYRGATHIVKLWEPDEYPQLASST